jgi:hypothetical protein
MSIGQDRSLSYYSNLGKDEVPKITEIAVKNSLDFSDTVHKQQNNMYNQFDEVQVCKSTKKKSYTVSNFKNLSFHEISRFFDVPITQAAEGLGVSESYLKRLCRVFSITRWPYRRVRSLQEKIDRLQESLTDDPFVNVDHVNSKVETLQKEMEEIFEKGLRESTSKRRRPKDSNGIKKRGRPPKVKVQNLETAIVVSPMENISSPEPSITSDDSFVDDSSQDLENFLDIDDIMDDWVREEPIFWQNQPLGFSLQLDVSDVLSTLRCY